MAAYGYTPISEENGTGLGLAFVLLNTDVNGVVQTAGRQYWNHATKVYEPGPRDDAKHLKLYQRLTDVSADFDNLVQVVAIERQALEPANTIIVVYTVDSTGKATGILRSYEHNVAQAMAGVNSTNF